MLVLLGPDATTNESTRGRDAESHGEGLRNNVRRRRSAVPADVLSHPVRAFVGHVHPPPVVAWERQSRELARLRRAQIRLVVVTPTRY